MIVNVKFWRLEESKNERDFARIEQVVSSVFLAENNAIFSPFLGVKRLIFRRKRGEIFVRFFD